MLPGAKRNAKPSPAQSLAAALERATSGATARGPLTKASLGVLVGGAGAVTAAKRRPNLAPNDLPITDPELATNAGAGDNRQSLETVAEPRQPEEIMEIPKDQILQLLRGRGHHDSAQQADQQLPDQVDTEQHSYLLERLGIKRDELTGDIGKKLGL